MKAGLTTFCIFFCVLLTGCANTQKGVAAGTLGGSAVGAGIGAVLGNWGMGALLGAGLGALGGIQVQEHLDKKSQEKESKELEESASGGEVTSKPASSSKNFIEGHYEHVLKRKWVDTSKKERVWAEERQEGDRIIEGHYEERSIPSGHWEEHEEKVWIPDHYE